ncbi:MAG: hypothetical protein EHM20_05020 [Alphaproteobacteria bacterium]|nr:MAG: hypothetical protein EHM20_05020 [Alphaproteobacteria bacterium]
MKVLMIMMTMLMATSTYAVTCAVGVKCDKPEECVALGANHAVNPAGLCSVVAAGQSTELKDCKDGVASGNTKTAPAKGAAVDGKTEASTRSDVK